MGRLLCIHKVDIYGGAMVFRPGEIIVFPPQRGRDFVHQAGGGIFFSPDGERFFPQESRRQFFPAKQYKLPLPHRSGAAAVF